MLELTDIRKTRVAQEFREEGEEIAREKFALRLLAKDYPVAEIAELTELSIAKVKTLKKKRKR